MFGEQERSIIRSRVLAGLDRVRQQGKKLRSPKVEDAIRRHLSAGNGILKVAALVGVGSGTVQRVKKEMVGELAAAAVTTVEGPGARVDTVMQVSEMTLAGIWWLTAAVHIIIDRPSATSGRARSADLASGAKCILCHLDPVRFKPFLVVSLRLGQCRRLRQVGRLAFRRGQLDYARHLLGWRFIEIWSGCPAGRETCHLPRSVLPSPTRTSATLPHGVIEIIIGSCWMTCWQGWAAGYPIRRSLAITQKECIHQRWCTKRARQFRRSKIAPNLCDRRRRGAATVCALAGRATTVAATKSEPKKGMIVSLRISTPVP